MFDLSLTEKLRVSLDVDLPIEDRDWSCGLIVGPSGSGKSSVARELWPDAMASGSQWPDDSAIVDAFPAGMPIREITGLLSGVGLGSIPAWCKPYRVLSNGEQFRADMALMLAETPKDAIAVVDEFTSVVDRQVAQVASHAVQKAVRRTGRRLVAVTCHYDVTDWLQPDWVLELPVGELTWRSVQPRPPIQLDIYPVSRRIWPAFREFHYLSAELSNAAQCYAAWADGTLCAFSAFLQFPHPKTKNIKMSHRVVVTPDFQGLGIAGRMSEFLGQMLWEQGYRFRGTTSHPARIAYYRHSVRWREVGSKPRLQVGPKSAMAARQLDPRRLNTRTFEYTAPEP